MKMNMVILVVILRTGRADLLFLEKICHGHLHSSLLRRKMTMAQAQTQAQAQAQAQAEA